MIYSKCVFRFADAVKRGLGSRVNEGKQGGRVFENGINDAKNKSQPSILVLSGFLIRTVLIEMCLANGKGVNLSL